MDDPRGYHVFYRDGEKNFCPGCGRCNWHIGRSLAECAFCGTAIPLETSQQSGGIFTSRNRNRNH